MPSKVTCSWRHPRGTVEEASLVNRRRFPWPSLTIKAPSAGFEPALPGPKPDVLPLDREGSFRMPKQVKQRNGDPIGRKPRMALNGLQNGFIAFLKSRRKLVSSSFRLWEPTASPSLGPACSWRSSPDPSSRSTGSGHAGRSGGSRDPQGTSGHASKGCPWGCCRSRLPRRAR